ncbi:hypothetical protein SCHPADRAFT_605152 [Schizopora paradoxa]|uniref:Fungal pheromone STE3G-protein-coupled receptor n=1 Tax=Schizopora paradoxa TaxID=27342 RepID=A0A0H2RUV4_9AGAM|nr:hypothetical protein SCHPADRAFT_605152 [Schizopora paradoxa]
MSDFSPARIHFSRIQRADETIFLWLQVTGGQILLPILVLTIVLSRNVHRNPVFISFCCSWIVSSVVYSLLVYRGRSDPQDLSLDPSSQECLIQASLINGVLPLTTLTTFGVVLQFLSSLYSVKTRTVADSSRKRRLFTLSLLIFPYFVFFIFVIISVVIGITGAEGFDGDPIPDSNLALPGAFYCLILLDSSSAPGEFSLARAPFYLSLTVSSFSLLFEGTSIFIFRNMRLLHKLLPIGWTQVLFRIVAFSLYRFTLLCVMFESPLLVAPIDLFLTGVTNNNLYNGVIDFMQATVPLAVFLIFASEKDILQAWCFWRKNSKPATADAKVDRTASKESIIEAGVGDTRPDKELIV